MSDQDHVAEGDLFAYLQGERLPHVEQALARSPELRAELDRLSATLTGLRGRVGGMDVPDTQDLVDVACGQASPLQELRVAAYLRDSAEGRTLMTELLVDEQPSRRRRGVFALALPSLALGTRSGDSGAGSGSHLDPTFVAAELNAQLVLRMAPPAASGWELKGQVSSGGLPVPGVKVTLHGALQRTRARTTNPQGFFQFADVEPGSYHLRAALPAGTLLTRPFTLRDDDLS